MTKAELAAAEITYDAVAVIVDVARSRSHPDRQGLQREVTLTFDAVNTQIEALQPLEATIGDEFQAAYADLPTALRATLLASLYLPEGVECRFGLGRGKLQAVGTSRHGAIQDGSAWWSARDAVDEARNREYSKLRFVRTWFLDAADTSSAMSAEGAPATTRKQSRADDSAAINSYLLVRDHLTAAMNPRERRLLLGQLAGKTQASLARAEGITQSAVSQSLHRSGAIALLAGDTLLAP